MTQSHVIKKQCMVVSLEWTIPILKIWWFSFLTEIVEWFIPFYSFLYSDPSLIPFLQSKCSIIVWWWWYIKLQSHLLSSLLSFYSSASPSHHRGYCVERLLSDSYRSTSTDFLFPYVHWWDISGLTIIYWSHTLYRDNKGFL